MKTSTDEQFRQLTDTVKPTRRLRFFRWLWYRRIDPEALAWWTAILLLLAGLWSLIGYAIWRILS